MNRRDVFENDTCSNPLRARKWDDDEWRLKDDDLYYVTLLLYCLITYIYLFYCCN